MLQSNKKKKKEIKDIKKIVKSLKDSNLLLKGVRKTIKDEVKKQKWQFISMLLGTLGESLLGNMLTGKGINRERYGFKDIQCKGGKRIIRAGHGSKGSLVKDF